MTLADIFRSSKPKFALAISLTILEKVSGIIEPTLLGRLIDAFIAAFQTGERTSYAGPLAVWTGIFLLNSGLGSLRRVIDPRIYLRIFARIAVYIAESCRSDGQTTSKAALRTELSREYISFLKGRIPDFIEQIFDMGGVVIALAFYDPRISLLCLTVTVPMIAIGRLYNHKVLRYQKEFHDERESVFAVLQMPKIQDVRDYHESMIRPQIRIADWGALSFGSLRLILLGIFLIVLYIVIAIDRLSTGEIYSVVAYLWTFVTASEYLPDFLESFTSLKDIQNRIRREPSVPESKSNP